MLFLALIVVSVIAIGALVLVVYRQSPQVVYEPLQAVYPPSATEFTIGHQNGVPDFRAFVTNLPRHGNYEFDYINSYGDAYRFRVLQTPDGYRTYVISQPDYRGRPRDGHSTHLILSADGTLPFICHKPGHEPRDLPSAAAIAAWWSHCTSRYIRTGNIWS